MSAFKVSGMGAGVPKGLWWLREKRRWGPTGVGGSLIYRTRRRSRRRTFKREGKPVHTQPGGFGTRWRRDREDKGSVKWTHSRWQTSACARTTRRRAHPLFCSPGALLQQIALFVRSVSDEAFTERRDRWQTSSESSSSAAPGSGGGTGSARYGTAPEALSTGLQSCLLGNQYF